MRIPDIDLNDLDAFEAGLPHEWFRRLRKEAPVYWHDEPDGPGYWVVTKYADLRHVSTKPAIFSSARGTNIFDLPPDGLRQIQALLINMDPPQHVKHRRLVQKGFTPRHVRPLEPRIREICGKLIDELVHRDGCELVGDLAAELPMQVICELVGVPFEDRHLVYDLSNRLIGFDDPDYGTRVQLLLPAARARRQRDHAHRDDARCAPAGSSGGVCWQTPRCSPRLWKRSCASSLR
jgi:cholest-4-en-3-one 26-monooxygenase